MVRTLTRDSPYSALMNAYSTYVSVIDASVDGLGPNTTNVFDSRMSLLIDRLSLIKQSLICPKIPHQTRRVEDTSVCKYNARMTLESLPTETRQISQARSVESMGAVHPSLERSAQRTNTIQHVCNFCQQSRMAFGVSPSNGTMRFPKSQ